MVSYSLLANSPYTPAQRKAIGPHSFVQRVLNMPSLFTSLFVHLLERNSGRPVKTGVFGEDMKVHLVNDGPVTIWIDSRNRE